MTFRPRVSTTSLIQASYLQQSTIIQLKAHLKQSVIVISSYVLPTGVRTHPQKTHLPGSIPFFTAFAKKHIFLLRHESIRVKSTSKNQIPEFTMLTVRLPSRESRFLNNRLITEYKKVKGVIQHIGLSLSFETNLPPTKCLIKRYR